MSERRGTRGGSLVVMRRGLGLGRSIGLVNGLSNLGRLVISSGRRGPVGLAIGLRNGVQLGDLVGIGDIRWVGPVEWWEWADCCGQGECGSNLVEPKMKYWEYTDGCHSCEQRVCSWGFWNLNPTYSGDHE
ncbi:hypothetical protein Tco_0731663 [Tanacetum coccineum]